jgi:hypothetical protein
VTVSEDALTLAVVKLEALQDQFRSQRDSVVDTYVGELAGCSVCSRPMVPRSVWEKLPPEIRDRLKPFFGKQAKTDRCNGCLRNNAMSEAELERVRRSVGLIK